MRSQSWGNCYFLIGTIFSSDRFNTFTKSAELGRIHFVPCDSTFSETLNVSSFCAPIARIFDKYHIPYKQIHRTTHNPQLITKNADIIISCVGKPQRITKNMVKPGVVLIGVGISRENGKLVGDYDEEEIKDVASYYTPTPGGVGPLTVGFLLKNLIDSFS